MNVVIFLTLLAVTTGVALRYGGAPERWTAGMLLVATLATFLVYEAPETRFYTIEEQVAVVDLLLLCGLTAILLCADRFWPILMFAVHGLTVLAHVVMVLDATIIRRAYLIATAAPGYTALLILFVAVIRHRRRLGRGEDRDWNAACLARSR